MRAPINIRPWLGVRKTVNAKGMSLWAVAYLNCYQASNDDIYLKYATDCLNWLTDNSAKEGYAGHCWGYPYPWQDAGFFAPTNMPNCVVTCFVARAYLKAYEITNNQAYLDIARSVCDFLLTNLTRITETDDMLCLSYAPVDMDWVVMDTSALSAVVIAKVARFTNESALKRDAHRLLNYVIDKKTDYGAWYYSHPPSGSHITHDNYHTGFIVDAILDYSAATKDDRFMDHYWHGLKFYQEHLFEPDGAPKWMYNKSYPYDIHGAAQGIITFSKAAQLDNQYLKQAEQCADWAINNMYIASERRFRYQKRRFFSKNYTLLRWCNAWMVRALSEPTLVSYSPLSAD